MQDAPVALLFVYEFQDPSLIVRLGEGGGGEGGSMARIKDAVADFFLREKERERKGFELRIT